MKYVDNILYLTYAEIVPHILSESNYKASKARGNINVIGRGGNGREVLIEYETLPAKYKEAVLKKYGNPYEYLAKQPILNLINWDDKAHSFYTNYVLPNELKLPEAYVEKYTKAANWLNTIIHLTTDKRDLKRTLNVSVGAFWGLVTDMILKQDIALPTSEKRLKEKIKSYSKEGYECIIEAWRFGNSNSKKVTDEEAEAFLLQLLSDPRQHDDTIIAMAYNDYAKKHNKPTISHRNVGYWKKNNAHLITASRLGSDKSYNKYSKRIQRERPSAPLLFINSDDNVLDMYFREESYQNGRKQVSKFYRPVLYVVRDAFNDYVLGYAIGEVVTHELIYAAFRNAMNHIIELTGSAYLPHQLQTDNWGLDVKKENELAKFFKSVATFTPQSHKVAQAKYIERSFGTEWHQVLKLFPNYGGFNVGAKEKLPAEYLQEASKHYPNKERGAEIVEGFIQILRQKVNPKTGMSSQEEWLNAFHASAKSQKRAISDEVRLQIFGIKHPHQNRITANGIRATIEGAVHTFDLPDEVIWKHNGKAMQVIYDPYDLTKVLLTDGNGLRLMAGQYEKMPSALADFKAGDRERLNNLLEGKKRIGALIGEKVQERKALLERAKINADSHLQASVQTKALKQKAERIATGYVPFIEEAEVVEVSSEPQFDWRSQM